MTHSNGHWTDLGDLFIHTDTEIEVHTWEFTLIHKNSDKIRQKLKGSNEPRNDREEDRLSTKVSEQKRLDDEWVSSWLRRRRDDDEQSV